MKPTSKELLRRLGAGESITQACAAAGMTRVEFDAWWQAEIRSRVPDMKAGRQPALRESVNIERDARGVPHIQADHDEDLFFGFGYALAQERLSQLDYLRRRGSGRLAEVLGGDGAELDLLTRVPGFRSVFEVDLLARTVGIRRIAEKEWTTLSPETRTLVEAFTKGINAWMEKCGDCWPIEFDLLDYRPEPWSPVDCLTIEGEFRWYLTGRFPVIVIPELARRTLGDDPLYHAFLQVEEDQESILPRGSYAATGCGVQPVGVAAGDPQGGQGSNNWVVAGQRTPSGKPLLASDPHIAFDAVSCWYEVHLQGGSFHVAGAAYVGMPAVLFGRNERVAWGCTNNILSQRDLYQERTDPAHPDCYLYEDRWEPARKLEEIIRVKNAEPVRKTVRFSRNGPIVNEVLPPLVRGDGPVSLRWLGAYHGGWLTALLDMNRAKSATEFREALRPWHVPTFNVIFADVDGHIGYQASGRVPLRNMWERGYRPGWDPDHQWQGLIPFDGMPRLTDPERHWIATANNRPAPDDFPYPLSGTWSEGQRACRIRQMIEVKPMLSREDYGTMHRDALSLRAQRCVPALVRALSTQKDARIQEALRILQGWDCRLEPDRVGATLFEVFFSRWTRAVAAERFDEATAGFVAGAVNGLAAALLVDDTFGWFSAHQRDQVLLAAMVSALDWLTQRLGSDMKQWTWSRLHVLPLKHVLSGRGDLGALLDHGGMPVPGTSHTVCNTGLGPNFESRMGANYRMIADLSGSDLWSVDSQSQSGHPGSPHYGDQLQDWLVGKYHRIALGLTTSG